MKPSPLLVALGVLLLAACSKSSPGKSGGSAAPASEPPKRNMSESLGFVSADPDSYSAPPPPSSSPAQPQSQPSPPAPTAAEAAVAPASVTRTLTSRDGRTVEAALLSRTASTVKIRRKADSVEFTIPLDRLSDADQAFITGSSIPVVSGH